VQTWSMRRQSSGLTTPFDIRRWSCRASALATRNEPRSAPVGEHFAAKGIVGAPPARTSATATKPCSALLGERSGSSALAEGAGRSLTPRSKDVDGAGQADGVLIDPRQLAFENVVPVLLRPVWLVPVAVISTRPRCLCASAPVIACTERPTTSSTPCQPPSSSW
jgi:hypothetical protein